MHWPGPANVECLRSGRGSDPEQVTGLNGSSEAIPGIWVVSDHQSGCAARWKPREFGPKRGSATVDQDCIRARARYCGC